MEESMNEVSSLNILLPKFEYRIQVLCMQIKALKENESNLKQRMEDALYREKSRNDQLNQDIQSKDTELQECIRNCDQIKAKNTELQEKIDAIVMSKQHVEQQLASFLDGESSAIFELEEENEKLRQEIKNTEIRFLEAHEKLISQSSLVEAIEKEFSRINCYLNDTRVAVNFKEESVSSLQTLMKGVMGKFNLAVDVQRLEDEVSALSHEIEMKNHQIVMMTELMTDQGMDLPPKKESSIFGVTKDEYQGLLQEWKKLEASLQQERSTFFTQQKEVENFRLDVAELTKANQLLRQQVNEGESIEKAAIEEIAELENQLENTKKRLKSDEVEWQMKEDILKRKIKSYEDRWMRFDRRRAKLLSAGVCTDPPDEFKDKISSHDAVEASLTARVSFRDSSTDVQKNFRNLPTSTYEKYTELGSAPHEEILSNLAVEGTKLSGLAHLEENLLTMAPGKEKLDNLGNDIGHDVAHFKTKQRAEDQVPAVSSTCSALSGLFAFASGPSLICGVKISHPMTEKKASEMELCDIHCPGANSAVDGNISGDKVSASTDTVSIQEKRKLPGSSLSMENDGQSTKEMKNNFEVTTEVQKSTLQRKSEVSNSDIHDHKKIKFECVNQIGAEDSVAQDGGTSEVVSELSSFVKMLANFSGSPPREN